MASCWFENMKSAMVWIAVCLCLVTSVCADAFSQEAPDARTSQARQARDRGDVETLQTIFRSTREEAGRSDNFDNNLRVALYANYLCEAAQDHENSKVVKQATQAGVAAAKRAVQLKAESSEAHRLEGELLGELIPHVFAGGMRYGKQSTEEIEKAIKLDPQNANACVARGIGYFFTPKTFGGDKDKAIEMMKKAIATAPSSDAAETAHIWLARIYQSLGKSDPSAMEIQEALAMNPERLFAKLTQGQARLK